MLLNDDVVIRTPGWDELVLPWLRGYPDGIVLVHVNDTLIRHHLCTFPLVSRIFCELAGGICPAEYHRYRIDDHIFDIFNLLALLGERRTIYLPEVLFEHLNGIDQPGGSREYHADPVVLADDAPRFEALFRRRKELALRLLDHIEAYRQQQRHAMQQRQLDEIHDPFFLRSPSRLRIEPIARPVVTVAVLTPDSQTPTARRCLDAIRANTPGMELMLIEQRSECVSRLLNRAVRSATTDYLALIRDDALVESGWLDVLVGCMLADVAMVYPKCEIESSDWPMLLLDRGRCAHLCFDEVYEHHFMDIDFALRVHEAGLRVVCTRATRVSVPHRLVDPSAHERDRQRFVRRWPEPLPETMVIPRMRGGLEDALGIRPPPSLGERLLNCYRNKGIGGLVHAAARRLMRISKSQQNQEPA
jgi:hypothetical protein